ncbi:sensor histidine kinase [Hymenobacter cellulosivorans]|uniref:Histidine kinase n=1 Tax=Hymenobacter cellulosivorans TaxID=2932249 RepID=A0ABY4FKF0_9BACT|nr:histidine kinase [Hymenobacter cellulosivorans]UOQ55586.1 histidine kinase [Hymenobacter cellulosivorans]
MRPSFAFSPRHVRVLGSLLIGLCVTMVYYAASVLEPSGFAWSAVAVMLLLVFLMWEAAAAVSDYLDRRRPWARGIGVRLLLQVLGSAGLALVIVNVPYTLFKFYSLRYLENPGSHYTLPIFLLINGAALTLFGIVQGAQLGMQFLGRWRQAELQAERLQRESTQARLSALRQQVSPHFLFNNLNILSVLIDRSQPLAKEFVEQFAQVYRYVLSSQERELVPVAEELEMVQAYVFLLQQRFAAGLVVELDVPAVWHQHYLPPLALQMLIENAIKHNVVAASRPLVVAVRAQEEGTLLVTNNVQARGSQEKSTGLGLANIAKRYEFLSERRLRIEHGPTTFTVELPLLELEPA